MSDWRWLSCIYKRGAFSGERVIEIGEGGGFYASICPVSGLRTVDDRELTECDPPPNELAEGKVRVQVSIDRKRCLVAFPDGEKVIKSTTEVEEVTYQD